MDIQRIEPGKRMAQAVTFGDMVYLAGQVASDTVGTGVTIQTQQILSEIDRLLAASGSGVQPVDLRQNLLGLDRHPGADRIGGDLTGKIDHIAEGDGLRHALARLDPLNVHARLHNLRTGVSAAAPTTPVKGRTRRGGGNPRKIVIALRGAGNRRAP